MDHKEVVKEFVECLKESYQERQLSCEEQWPPVSGERLINLQLVEAEKKEGFRSSSPQHGAVDDHAMKRTAILHGELFESKRNKKAVRKVVVEGNAGIGKTTLCTVLTQEWADNKILTQFECVLLLPLRDRMVSSASSLPDLLALYHPDESICECVVRHLKRTRGKGVLIIADGWDELDEPNRSKESFMYNLLFGHLLPSASVLLTSRPAASADLHDLPSVDRLVEVVGFNVENIKQYIESEFETCPEKAVSLLKQLESNPLVQNVCSVPLNCAIVCNLWHTMEQALPNTLTELYTTIVLNVLFRNLRKAIPNKLIGLSLKNFDSIPEHLHDMFWSMCKFAYKCLKTDQLVFSEDKLASFFPSLNVSEKLLCFGLLQSARSLLPVGYGVSFHFAHLTFQEFLAALHLATQPNEEKLEAIDNYARNFRFAIVWRFFFGLAIHKRNPCSQKVICLDDTVIEQFFCAFYYRWDSLILCHTAFESKDEIYSWRVAEYLRGHFKVKTERTASPKDGAALLYALRHTSTCSEMELNFASCGLNDRHLKELTDTLSNEEKSLKVKKLSLQGNHFTSEGVNDLFRRAEASLSCVQELELQDNEISHLCTLPSMKPPHTFRTKLSLSNNPLGVYGMQMLEEAVLAGKLKHLNFLDLHNTLTDDADINGALLTMFLLSVGSNCPKLQTLDISRNTLKAPGASAVLNNSPNISVDTTETGIDTEASIILADNINFKSFNFGTLNLHDNPLCFDGLLALLRILRMEACPITILDLTNTSLSRDQKSLSAQQLNLGPPLVSGKLNHLVLSKCDLSKDQRLLLAECIRVCRSLRILNCCDCSLTSADIKALMTNLKSSKSSHKKLATFALWYNIIDDEGIYSLIESLPELFPNLQNVYLDDNPVSEEVQENLKICLRSNTERRKKQSAREARRAEEEALRAFQERRVAVLTEWEKTQLPPQNDELLAEFVRMWEELLWILSYHVYVRSKYPHLYGLPDHEPFGSQNHSRPPTPSDDGSFHSATDEPDKPAVGSTDTSPTVLPVDDVCDAIPELTLSILTKELKTLTKPIQFGIFLGIPQDRLEIIEQDHRNYTDGQKIALFEYIASNHKDCGITWSSIADALLEIHAGNLSHSIRDKYCIEYIELDS